VCASWGQRVRKSVERSKQEIVNPVLTVLKGTLELPWSTHVKWYIDTTKAACGKQGVF